MKNLKLLLTLLMTIVIGTGTMWGQAIVGTTLFSENFGGYSKDDVPSGSVSSETGNRVVYGGGSVTYTSADGAGTKPGTTKVYEENVGGGTSPELMVGKKGTGTGAAGGSFSIAGIPSGGAKEITVSWTQNAQNLSASVSGTGYSGSLSGKPDAVGTRTFDITVADGADDTFTLTFQAAATSNVRVDDILVTVKTAGAISTPYVTVTPASLDFGTVLKATENVTESIDLKGENLTGNVTLSIATATYRIASPEYPAGLTSLTIKPTDGGIDTTITITAYKGEEGEFNAGLTISSAASEFSDVPVSLHINVIAPVTSYDIDFETNNLAAYVNWEFSNLTIDNAITARGGTKYAKTNGTGTAAITTKEKIALPGTITYYISKVGTNTNANSKWKARVSSDGLTWTVVGDENAAGAGVTEGTWNACSADLSGYTDVYVQVYYEGTTAVRTIDDVLLEMRDPAAVEKPVISGVTPFYKSTHVTITCPTDGATIYYTLNGDEPDPDDAGGSTETYKPEEGINLSATTTIKAIAVKGSDRSEGVVSKEFIKADVLSVAEARTLIDGGVGLDNQFVEGYIYRVESYNGTYHSLTYWLTEDGHKGDSLEVYSGKGLSSADFSGLSDLSVGDKVVVCGTLKKYNDIYEFDKNNFLVERTEKGGVVSIALDGGLTKTSDYEAGDNISIEGLTAIATYANGYMEDVTAEATWTIDGDAEGTILSASEQHTIRATYGGQYAEDVYDFEANEHTVTFADPENGTLEIEDAGSPVASGDAFVKGTTLYITATSDAGYQLGSITVNGSPLDGDEITVGTEDITIAATFVEETPVYSVVGPGVDNDGIFPKNWDPTDTETEMTLNEGVYSYTLENVILQTSVDYAYKIVKGHAWGVEEYPSSGNETFSVDKDGKYNVTFTLNPSTGTYNANPELIQEIAVNRKFAVAGDFNSWSTTPVELTPDAATASITISGLTKGDYAFKVIVNGAWLGNTQTFKRDNNLYAGIIANEDPNMTLHVDVPGDYVFTWTYETNQLEITYPAKPALPMEWSKKDGYTITYGENIDESEYSRLMIAPSLQGLEITVTSDAPEVVEYNSKGYDVDGYTVYYDIHKAGVATITASFAGNEDYAETSVSYTLTVNKGDSKLEWSTTSFNANVRTDASDYPELSFAADIDVSKITYSSDNNEVATIDADGKITLLQGDYAVLITATFAGDDKYENAEASYWLSTEKVDPVLSWSESTASATIGGSNEFPTLTNEDGVPVTYSSDNAAAVYINPQTGEITLLQPGTVTISASFDGNGLFNSAYAEYTLTVAGEAVEEDILLGLALSSYEFEINVGETLPKPTVEAHYSLSGNIDVTAEAIFDDAAFNNAIAGTYTINVSYNDENGRHAEATYTVKVKDTATAIGNAEMGEKAVKVIENNQLIIIKNGVKYTISGSKIR